MPAKPKKSFNMSHVSDNQYNLDITYNAVRRLYTNGQMMNSEVNLRLKPASPPRPSSYAQDKNSTIVNPNNNTTTIGVKQNIANSSPL